MNKEELIAERDRIQKELDICKVYNDRAHDLGIELYKVRKQIDNMEDIEYKALNEKQNNT